MKVLITGAGGQLGKDLEENLKNRYHVYAFNRSELDITNQDQTQKLIYTISPDIIIHCAAYTSVDLAESEEDQAYKVNTFGTRNVVCAAEEVGAKLCFISTDYVFDGLSYIPYKEYDNLNPSSIYGKTKKAAEQLVQTLSSKYFIVRTSWLYGNHGNNFVKSMLQLSKEKNSIKVVNDQIGAPTNTIDLTYFISDLVTTDKYGIYHATNTGQCSWYEFALAIFEEYDSSIQVEPCTTEEFKRPAPRPKYSVLDHLAIRANNFNDFRNWREALKDFMRNYH
jgi:dTDP-4-dehydrorhamnose reductase